MPDLEASERTDTLLALALAFARDEGGRAPDDVAEGDDAANSARAEAEESARARELLAGFAAAERDAASRRLKWYERLGPEERARWLWHTLRRARAREKHARLDEHVHPSHLVTALRAEPARVQSLILEHLPPALSAACAAALGHDPGGIAVHGPQAGGTSRASRSVVVNNYAPQPATQAANARNAAASSQVDAGVMEVVRRAFLSRFAALSELRDPAPLDTLSAAELARLVRLLGVRETAIACRGIANVEAVTAFLRRFPAEDARAVATQIAALTDVEPARIVFAESLVHEALQREPEPGAMLDRVGLELLAITLAGHPAPRLRYTAQKFPPEVADELRDKVAAHRGRATGDMHRRASAETEALAATFRRPPAAQERTPPRARREPAADAPPS